MKAESLFVIITFLTQLVVLKLNVIAHVLTKSLFAFLHKKNCLRLLLKTNDLVNVGQICEYFVKFMLKLYQFVAPQKLVSIFFFFSKYSQK